MMARTWWSLRGLRELIVPDAFLGSGVVLSVCDLARTTQVTQSACIGGDRNTDTAITQTLTVIE